MSGFTFIGGIPDSVSTRNHFIIQPHSSRGWTVTVCRIGKQRKIVFCPTKALANQQRLKLSDSGLIGYLRG